MAKRTVNERSKATLTANLTSSTGGAISSTALDWFRITLYNRGDSTGTIINTRDGSGSTGTKSDGLNANNSTIGSTGLWTMHLQAEDNIIVDATTKRDRKEERHELVAAWQWGGSTGNVGRKCFDIYVQDLSKVS